MIQHKKLSDWFVLGLLLAVGLALRLWDLVGQSLWVDEVFSIHAAEKILAGGLRAHLFNRHGPLFSYVLAGTLAVTSGEFAARFPSVLFGIGFVWVAWLLGKEFLSAREAWCAGAAAALSPFAVWYSQESRYVSLFLLLSALSLLFSRRLLEEGRWWDLIGYSIWTLLMLFSFVGGVFLVIAQNLCVPWTRYDKHTWIRWGGAQLLMLIVFVPWLARAYGIMQKPFESPNAHEFQVSTLRTGTPRLLNPAHAGYALYAFGVGYSFGPSVRELHSDLSLRPVLNRAYEVVPAVLVISALGFAGARRLAGEGSTRALLLMLCMAIPIAGTYLIASLTDISFNVRYASCAFPAFVVLMAAGVSGLLRDRWVGKLVVGIGFTVCLISLLQYYTVAAYARDDNRSAAKFLAERREEDEPLVVGLELRGFQHYYSGPILKWSRVRIGHRGEMPADVPRLSGPRVWFAVTRTWDESRFNELLARMHDCFALEERRAFPGFEVMSFRIDQPLQDPPCVIADTL